MFISKLTVRLIRSGSGANAHPMEKGRGEALRQACGFRPPLHPMERGLGGEALRQPPGFCFPLSIRWRGGEGVRLRSELPVNRECKPSADTILIPVLLAKESNAAHPHNPHRAKPTT